MGATRAVTIGEGETARPVVVRELTVREARDRVAAYKTGAAPLSVVDLAIWGDMTLSDIAWQCDAPLDALEQYTPSELAPLVEACREINNCFFFGMVLLLQQLQASPTTSTEAAAP